VQATPSEIVLDWEQFRAITLDDEELMREILGALIDDTSRQMFLLQNAISASDRDTTRRLAHYSKGACANVGAKAAAFLLQRLEADALHGDFAGCDQSLAALGAQLERLRGEVSAI
jgi:HPt (histidine-containing phosphotransfer) domain-containing protein